MASTDKKPTATRGGTARRGRGKALVPKKKPEPEPVEEEVEEIAEEVAEAAEEVDEEEYEAVEGDEEAEYDEEAVLAEDEEMQDEEVEGEQAEAEQAEEEQAEAEQAEEEQAEEEQAEEEQAEEEQGEEQGEGEAMEETGEGGEAVAENGENGQGEEYQIVDEVSSDAEDSKKKEEEEEEKDDENRGFIPNSVMLNRDAKELRQSCTLVAKPVTPSDLKIPEINELINKADLCILHLHEKKEDGEISGMMDLRFLDPISAAEAKETIKEHCSEIDVHCMKDAESRRTVTGWSKKKSDAQTRGFEFRHDCTLALFNVPNEVEVADIRAALTDAKQVMIPYNEDGVKKCYAMVEFENKEKKIEVAETKTVTLKKDDQEYELNIFEITEGIHMRKFLATIDSLNLEKRFYRPMSHGLKRFYNKQIDTILYFLKYATDGDLQGTSKEKLTKIESKLRNKLSHNKRLEAQEDERRKEREEKDATRKKEMEERRKERDEKRKAAKEAGGDDKDTDDIKEEKEEKEDKPSTSKDRSKSKDIKRRSGDTRDNNRDRRDDRNKRGRFERSPRRDGGNQGNRRFNDNRRPGYSGGGYNRGGVGGQGMGMQGGLNQMTGLPNANYNQMQMMQQNPMMQQMQMGGMMGGVDGMGNKTESAINLLLGLSKMLKGGNNQQPENRGRDYF